VFAGVAVAAGVVAIVAVVLWFRHDSGSSSANARKPLDGFGETQVTVTNGSATMSWCLLLAATEAQRNRGLMQVTDPTLGGYAGMLFRFDGDSNDQFYMRNTPMPLSIAFVAADGKVISTTDMAPCADRPGCPLYSAAAPYRTAIEVPQGQLQHLGIDTGATVIDNQKECA
jgi:uncharacterized membrane protein (UPF0127 family)